VYQRQGFGASRCTFCRACQGGGPRKAAASPRAGGRARAARQVAGRLPRVSAPYVHDTPVYLTAEPLHQLVSLPTCLPACLPPFLSQRSLRVRAPMPSIRELWIPLMAAKQEPVVLFCMPDRANRILLVSATIPGVSACLSRQHQQDTVCPIWHAEFGGWTLFGDNAQAPGSSDAAASSGAGLGFRV
jgi:hypothetical protein